MKHGMNMKWIGWLSALVLLALAGCGRNFNPMAPQAGYRLQSAGVSAGGKILEEDGCFHGVFLGSSLSGPFALENLTAFEAAAGKGVRVVAGYVAWGLNSDFPAAACDQIVAHGSYPMICWEPWSYTGSDPNWSNQTIISGQKDEYILRWANAIKNWGKPVFLRPMYEMNGNWYPWSVNFNGNTYESFIAAWRHIVDLFNSVGAQNATWVWSPNWNSVPVSNSISQCYPGDSYVDWTSLNGYNWGTTQSWSTWMSFYSIFSQAYQEITALTFKPMVIGEYACTEIGGDKAAWITDALTVQIKNYFPRIKAVVWFNENKETNWRTDSSPASQAAYTAAVADSYYLGSLGSTPVPTPTSGPTAVPTPTPTPAPAAPVIANIVESNITASSARISWTTDIAADSAVLYGLTTALGSTISDPALTASHGLNLTGLTKNTNYFYAVRSSANGQTTTSSTRKFRTKAK